jgi:DNA ligase-1
MNIKSIFDEITAEGGSNAKMDIMRKYKDFPFLKRVLYLACSRRIKFYIKQIPEYTTKFKREPVSLHIALMGLEKLSDREVTGNAAIEHLSRILSSVSADDANVIERVIKKDLRIGMGTTNINKVFPNLIEKTPYMGAVPYNKELIKSLLEETEFLFSDIKMDGRYANVIIRSNDVEMESRDGEPTYLPAHANVLRELSMLPDCVLNGELTIPGIPRYLSNGIISSVISIQKKIIGGIDVKKEIQQFEKKHSNYVDACNSIVFTAWDFLTVDQYFAMKADVPYEVRRQHLKGELRTRDFDNVRLIRSTIVRSVEEAMNHFRAVAKRGEEGTILKSPYGTWVNGKPKYQVKVKLEMTVDLEIIDFSWGTGKNAKVISSIVCQSKEGKLVTTPAGMNEQIMKFVTDNRRKLKNTIMEVTCSGMSKDSDDNWSLLHPRISAKGMAAFRDDKKVANSFKEIVAIEKSLKEL